MDKNKEQKTRQTLLDEGEHYKNIMMVPRFVKVVVSMGIAEAAKDKNNIQRLYEEIALVTGQRPIKLKAKKSISNFKTRAGSSILGLKVTLRGSRMFHFLNMLVNIASPRIRDFRGYKRSFSGGNCNFGLCDHRVFPGVPEDTPLVHGMNITFVTTATNNKDCETFLEAMEFPFKKK